MSRFNPARNAASVLAALIASCLAVGVAAAADAPPKAPAKAAPKAARKAPPAPVATTLADASPEQAQAAELVYYGTYDCEFQQTVLITQSPKHTSYVDVKAGKSSWLMKPVLSSTGAIRLEDVRGETLMVQISSKSMLLNVKTAQRIVDDCISPKQRELIAEAKAAKATAEAAKATADAAKATADAASSVKVAADAAPATSPSAPAAASAMK